MMKAIMSGSRWRGRVGVVVIALACGVRFGTPVMGQQAPTAAGPGEIESDPIKCWWKTDRRAVHVGEQFTLILTCGVIETGRVRVVADPNRLDPTAVELTPFEVLGGTRHEDVQAPPWRYFQYSYTLRLIGDEFFGKDIDIPSLQMTYNVQSAGGGGTQGRDQLYVLPALPMRILSLVPGTAGDISDAPLETFADRESRLFRATGELAAAAIFFGFAVVLAGLAVVRSVGRSRGRVVPVARPLPAAAVLGGCIRETGRLQSEVAREGWTPELTGRALAVLRIAGAVALGRPVAQALVDRHVPGREGQLLLRKGRLRPKHALISAPTTEAAMAGQLASRGRESDEKQTDSRPHDHALLEEIRHSLGVFRAARYSRNGYRDAAALDAALDQGLRAIQRLRVTKLWPRRAADAVAKAAADLRGTVWSR